MKNKKGFTLIEMIGIIILLVVIMLVVAPSMISSLTNSNTKRFDTFKDNLKIAVENYIVQTKQTSQENVQVTLQILLDENYIDEIPSIPSQDPLAEDGNEELSGNAYVIAVRGTSGYHYQLCKSESICEDI